MLASIKVAQVAISVGLKLVPAVKKLIKATRKDSPGGKRLTPREREAIIRKLFPLVEELVDDIAKDLEDDD